MGAAVGWWQTGPGGIVANLVASGLYSLGAKGLSALFAKPTLAKQAEQLLDNAALHVPPGKIAEWLALPTTVDLVAAVPKRVLGTDPTDADDIALEKVVDSFHAFVGSTASWNDELKRKSLMIVLTRVLSGNVELNHHLSTLRAEGMLDTNFIAILDDIAHVAATIDAMDQKLDVLLSRGQNPDPAAELNPYNVLCGMTTSLLIGTGCSTNSRLP